MGASGDGSGVCVGLTLGNGTQEKVTELTNTSAIGMGVSTNGGMNGVGLSALLSKAVTL